MPSLRKLFRSVGPGVITGASDDDPAGIVTYSQAGAKYGNQFLWLAWFTTPLMIAVQEMSARLGLVSGRGLADLIRRVYSSRWAWCLSVLLLLANVLNIGADLGALAEVTQLLMPGPRFFYITAFGALILGLEIFLTYRRYVRVLKWLTVALLAYVAVVVTVRIDWADVIRHFVVPSFPAGAGTWTMVVAILGTTISPYLFFWQESEETEERPANNARQISLAQIQAMRRDTITGMVASNIIMVFIIIATAATLASHGVTEITTARQAAEALRPLAGDFTFALFALGIIGTGLLAVPVLAGSAAYALAEVTGKREGLNRPFRQAKAFYGFIIGAVVSGGLLNIFGVPAVQMLITSAVVNGLLAPILIWFITRLADHPDVVGEHRSPRPVRILGWVTLTVMIVAGIMLIIEML